MLWSRALVFAACALALGACGFRPIYGDGDRVGAAYGELSAVRIEPIEDRVGQQLHNHLLDLLNPTGRPTEPTYALFVDLVGGTVGLAVAKNELATRANFRLTARYRLLPANGDVTLLSGSNVVVSSYNILSSAFSTLIAENDAKARAAEEMAFGIRNRLAAYFATISAPQGVPAQ
ncbi:MAG: LPS assembly lipoprotein LptE [Rhodospirillales bacterium]|nr:LPS assembly lipoprotein LptE [Rhodospirillales bacterium]